MRLIWVMNIRSLWTGCMTLFWNVLDPSHSLPANDEPAVWPVLNMSLIRVILLSSVALFILTCFYDVACLSHKPSAHTFQLCDPLLIWVWFRSFSCKRSYITRIKFKIIWWCNEVSNATVALLQTSSTFLHHRVASQGSKIILVPTGLMSQHCCGIVPAENEDLNKRRTRPVTVWFFLHSCQL